MADRDRDRTGPPAANGRGANEGERDWICEVATESVLAAAVNSDSHVKREI